MIVLNVPKLRPVANPLVYDPSRTTSLRRAFSADMMRRMTALKSTIYQLVVTEDVFGHRKKKPLRFTANTRFQFLTDDAKLKAFNQWFENEVKKGLLEVRHDGKPWTAKYVDSAYKKGRVNAYLQAHKEEIEKGSEFAAGSREQFLRTAFLQPETIQSLRLLGTRNYEQLKGISADMSSQLNRILASAIAGGKAPQMVAREISKSIDGITRRRALLLAQTELAYASAEGSLDSYEDLGVKEIGLKAEWTTSGLPNVCPRCGALEGQVFTIKQARGLIPLHPNCVLGDMRIETPSPISLMRSVFSGRVFEIFTAKGRRLAVTENHVLLTHRGWVKAKFITESDKLVDASSIGGLSFQTPDDYNNIPTIEENFHSFSEFGEIKSISCADTRPEYFHGDAGSFDEKIDIVRLDSLLRSQSELFFRSKRKQDSFVSGNVTSTHSVALDCESYFSPCAIRLAAASDCFMGFRSIASVFFRGSLAHHEANSFLNPSNGNTSIFQSFLDNKSSVMGHSKSTAQFGQGNSGLVEIDHLIKDFWRNVDSGLAELFFNSQKPSRRLRMSPLNSISFEQLANAFGRFVTDKRGYLLCRPSTQIQFDDVLRVNSRHVVNTPVYDVETQETIYNCNGILTSNCHCAWSPIYDVKASKLNKRQTRALGGPLPTIKQASIADAEKKVSAIEAQLDATYGVKISLPKRHPGKAIEFAKTVEQEIASIDRLLPKLHKPRQSLQLKLAIPKSQETPKQVLETVRKEVAKQIWEQRLSYSQKQKLKSVLGQAKINKKVLGPSRSPKGKWQALFAAYAAKGALQSLLPEALVELLKKWFE